MITACGPLIENGFQNGFSLFFLPSPPPTPLPPPPSTLGSIPFSPSPCRWQKGGNIGRTGRELGGGGRGEDGAQGENHPSATCHTYDSCVIRLINEIIDHLMGLIINSFFAHPSSVLLPLYTFYPPKRRNT